jgi:hypothetical protein
VIAGEKTSELTRIDTGERIGYESRSRHGISNW